MDCGSSGARGTNSYIAEIEGLMERKCTLNTGRSHSQREAIVRVTIQFDATFDKRSFNSASGLVVYGRSGKLLATTTVLHTNVPSPFAVGAFAGLQVLKLGIAMDLPSVTIMGIPGGRDCRPFSFESGGMMEKSPRLTFHNNIAAAMIAAITSIQGLRISC